MSEFSRETLLNIIETDHVQCGEASALARMALAAMDSEPVAWLLSGGGAKNVVCFDSGNAYADPLREVTQLYRHAQPAKTVQPVMFIDGDISSEDADKLAKVIREFNEEDERPLAKMARIIRENPHPTNECDTPKAQSAPVVPENVRQALSIMDDEIIAELDAEESACRAAMLAAAQHDTPALNSVQNVVTVPGKWIPVSEQNPDCWCLTCRPVTLNDMRFVVCPDCGNKRCPRANDHRNACTGSNEPGQEGSAYPDTPREVK